LGNDEEALHPVVAGLPQNKQASWERGFSPPLNSPVVFCLSDFANVLQSATLLTISQSTHFWNIFLFFSES
jgi:hypothetical protein